MAETLYPERQRCKKCRKGLDEEVYGGMYCSYKCGGYAPPAKKIDDASRACKRLDKDTNKWTYKVRYKSPKMVPEKWHKDPTTNIYQCDNCQTFHIGHSRVEEQQKVETFTRYVKDPKELGSVIQRHREALGIDKKLLAKKLNIPAIRITEIENGDPKVTVVTLMKVLSALRLNLTLSTYK